MKKDLFSSMVAERNISDGAVGGGERSRFGGIVGFSVQDSEESRLVEEGVYTGQEDTVHVERVFSEEGVTDPSIFIFFSRDSIPFP